jgi:hypothetical protein
MSTDPNWNNVLSVWIVEDDLQTYSVLLHWLRNGDYLSELEYCLLTSNLLIWEQRRDTGTF